MDKKFLIIDSRPYGLFSIFLHTVDNIKWAHENGYIPVVRWGPGRRNPNLGRKGVDTAASFNTSNSGVDKNNFLKPDSPPCFNNTPGMKHCQNLYWSDEGWNGSKNVWEYYFEPLNEFSVSDAESTSHDVADIFMVGEMDTNRNNKFLIKNLHSYEPLILWEILGTDHEKPHRQEVYEVIKNNITVKQEVMSKVNDFYNQHFNEGEDVIAVHVRGTDKKLEWPHKALPVESYLDAIEEKLSTKDSKIFVASDNNEAIFRIIKKFGRENVIVRPAVRMKKYYSPDPICLTSATGPQHGEECLIDCLLMSRCSSLICTDSNVAASAMYLNPASDVIYLNRLYGK